MKSLGILIGALISGAGLVKAADAAVQSVSEKQDEVLLTLNSGILELRPVGDNAIRVHFSHQKTAETASFVLKSKLPVPAFNVTDMGDRVTVRTAKIKAVVDRKTGALTFLDAKGNIFLAEKPGTRLLQPSLVQKQPTFSVGQEFESPSDEKLYGLGQFQDGMWDWRGVPVELRQLNTQIAIPMVVSNKGYGLLWDNASRTDFNLPGEQIPLASQGAPASSNGGPTATEQLDTAATKNIPKDTRRGTFTTAEAGEYVFCTRDGDRRGRIAIILDGVEIAGITNMWTPRAIAGRVSLPAHKVCQVAVQGGGRDVKLFARKLSTTTLFRSDCGQSIDYTVFYGPQLDDVIAGYRAATGDAPLWPKWAYGFWQCRERYSSQQHLLKTVAEFRKRQIPFDLIVQDWQYWGKHGWGSYEWDESQYPDPAALLKGLHDQNAKFMISVWCNPHGKAMEDLKANNMLAGEWIDVFNPKAREIRWKHINGAFFSIGTDAWWGDATEPGDPGTDLLGKQLSAGPGDCVTNSYPLFASQSLYEGQRATNSNKRVCILTRSAFPGQQRYAAAAWSGDINGTWETFQRQVPAGLNFCVTGQPYWTTDCGGFFHPNDQYKSPGYNELLTRWFQWSTFCPILRIHGFKTETEIWNWLPETQKTLLAYDHLRYRMLPYNYTVAANVTLHRSTIMRPLGMDFPDDKKSWNISDQYMFGPAFMVAPVTKAQVKEREVYLPSGTDWVNFWTGETAKGGSELTVAAPLETIPLLVRAGSIVPLGPDLQFATEKPADPLEIRVYPGRDGAFTLYEDEGDSYRYETGAYSTIPLNWNDKAKVLTIGDIKGHFPGMLEKRTFRFVLVSPGHGTGIEPAEKAVEVSYQGKALTVQL